MSFSPWDGSSRRALRIGLASVLALDAVVLGSALARDGPREESLHVVSWLLALAGRPALVIPLVSIVLAALVAFALDRRSLPGAMLAFVGFGLLSTALTAVQGAASRNFYVGGATLLGWILGEALEARYQRTGTPVARSSLAEAAAAGSFAATYFLAATSKLLHGGSSWLSPGTIQTLALAQAPISDSFASEYARLVASSNQLATAFAVATLMIQLLAPVWLLGRRLRALWGTLFIAFHVNVFVLTGIPYVESCFIAALFSYPWLRIGRRISEPAPASEPAPRATAWLVPALLVTFGLAARLTPSELRPSGDPYTGFRPPARANPGAPVRFGPIAPGDPLAAGWTVDSIQLDATRARLVVARREQRVVLVVSDEPGRPSPIAPPDMNLYYEQTAVPLADFEPASREIADRLRRAAAARPMHEAIRAWLDER